MTDLQNILLKELRKKKIISGDLEKESTSTVCDTVPFNKPSDLHVRDAVITLGTVLKEDLENHYYIISVKTGKFNNVLAYAIIQRKDDGKAELVVYAKEGLIKQNLAEKALEKIKLALS